MPENQDFRLEILVGGQAIPEYQKEGRYYVECNLTTPVSYKHRQSDLVSGEIESQEWPVTPYQINLIAKVEEPHYFRVFVDGVKVKGISMEQGQSKTIKGFRDQSSIREFLFSMPRFPKDQGDRLEHERQTEVGSIKVECWNAILRSSTWQMRPHELDFEQANKKDCSSVTQGDYTMATSRAGKKVASRSLYRNVDSWKRLSLRSQLSVSYHMPHTLQEMGFTLRPFPLIILSQPRDATRPDVFAGQPSATRTGRSGQLPGVKKEVPSSSVGLSADNPLVIKEEDEECVVPIAHSKKKKVPTATLR